MSYPCRVTQDLNTHFAAQEAAEVRASLIAPQQFAQVEEVAMTLLAGRAFISGGHTWTFQDVWDGVIDNGIDAGMMLGVWVGNLKAVFEFQKLVAEEARHVAFAALDFESNPFLDYDDLKSEAGQ